MLQALVEATARARSSNHCRRGTHRQIRLHANPDEDHDDDADDDDDRSIDRSNFHAGKMACRSSASRLCRSSASRERTRGKVTSKVMSDVTLVYRYFIHSKIKIFLTLTEHHAGAAGFHCFHCFALTARAAAVIDLIMEKVLSSTACGQETWQQKKRMACAKMSKD